LEGIVHRDPVSVPAVAAVPAAAAAVLEVVSAPADPAAAAAVLEVVSAPADPAAAAAVLEVVSAPADPAAAAAVLEVVSAPADPAAFAVPAALAASRLVPSVPPVPIDFASAVTVAPRPVHHPRADGGGYTPVEACTPAEDPRVGEEEDPLLLLLLLPAAVDIRAGTVPPAEEVRRVRQHPVAVADIPGGTTDRPVLLFGAVLLDHRRAAELRIETGNIPAATDRCVRRWTP